MQIKEYIKRVTVYAMGIVLIILMTLAFAYIWYNVYNIRIKLPFWRRGNILVVIIYGIILLLFQKCMAPFVSDILKKLML